MPYGYKYKAASPDGNISKGYLEAESIEAARDAISSRGLIPLLVDPAEKPGVRYKGFFKSSVNPETLLSFSQKLGTLYRAGIPFVRAMEIIAAEEEDAGFKKALLGIRESIEAGTTIAEAMKQFPEYFSSLYVNSMGAGETSGKLDEILSRLNDLTEREIKTQRMIKSAVSQPIYTLIVIAFAIVAVITVVLPKFAGFYDSFKTELPLPTRIVLALGDFVSSYWYIVILGTILLVFFFRKFIGTKKGRSLFDKFKLGVPLIGKIFQYQAISRFSYVLGTLLKAGIPLVESLGIVESTVGNTEISKAVRLAADNLKEGGDLISPLKTSKYFMPMVIQMLDIGMQSGNLDDQLFEVAHHYDEIIEYKSRTLSSRLEPILTILVSGLVLVLALAVFLPMWNLINVVK